MLSGPAKNALHDLVGTNKPKTGGDGVRATAKVLAAGISSEGESHELCTAYASSFNNGTSFTYALENELPRRDIDPRFTQYGMGALTLAKAKSAYLFMECKSPRFELPTSDPILLSGEIYNGHLPDSRDDVARDENLRLLHAVSLALVRELHCKNDAGLPTTFRMSPKATEGKT